MRYIVEVSNHATVWRDESGRKRHRLDGPAVEYASGTKEWYVDDKRHRLDGPAREGADGYKAWYVDGKRLTEEEFKARSSSCEGKVIEIDGKKYKLTSV